MVLTVALCFAFPWASYYTAEALECSGIVTLLFCGIVETSVWPASEYSGNYGTGYPFGDLSDPEVRAFKLNLELNQGRAAMLGIFAANLQEGIQGQTLAEHIASGGKILVPGLF